MFISLEMQVNFNINHYVAHIGAEEIRKLEYNVELPDVQKPHYYLCEVLKNDKNSGDSCAFLQEKH